MILLAGDNEKGVRDTKDAPEPEDKQEEKDGDDHGAKNGSAHAVLHTWPFCKRHKSTFRVLLPTFYGGESTAQLP